MRLGIHTGYEAQEAVWKNGPSCNRCTRYAKLPSMRNSALGIIATGANQSDTWGQTGIALKDGFYAPIRGWDKKLIGMALEELKIHVPRIGEAPVREGCKLKHPPQDHGQSFLSRLCRGYLKRDPAGLSGVLPPHSGEREDSRTAFEEYSPRQCLSASPVELRRITAMLGRVEEIDESQMDRQ